MTTGITSILKNILKFIAFIGAVVAAVFLLRAFVIEPFVVPTGSMESTIEVGDCILAQKITLETGSDLKPGDIVVFKNPRPRNGVDILVKRVIATSGQTVDLNPMRWGRASHWMHICHQHPIPILIQSPTDVFG